MSMLRPASSIAGTMLLLLELREVLVQALDICRVVQRYDVVGRNVQVLQVLGDALYQLGLGEVHPGLGEQGSEGLGVRTGVLGDEELFSLVLGADQGHQRLGGAFAEEDLALAEDDMLLQVDGHQLRGAEVFHCLGDLETEFLGEFEICIYGVAGGEYDGRVVGEINSLVAEFPGTQGLYAEERPESYICFKLALKGLVCGQL